MIITHLFLLQSWFEFHCLHFWKNRLNVTVLDDWSDSKHSKYEHIENILCSGIHNQCIWLSCISLILRRYLQKIFGRRSQHQKTYRQHRQKTKTVAVDARCVFSWGWDGLCEWRVCICSRHPKQNICTCKQTYNLSRNQITMYTACTSTY